MLLILSTTAAVARPRAALVALLVAAAALPCTTVWAQTPPAPPSPGAVQQQQQQDQERRAQEERLRRSLPPAELNLPRAAETATTSGSVAVTRFELDPSAILSPAEINAVLQPLQGRTVSFAELQAAVAALNALYDSRGYASARALLPPQTVQAGVVRIRLVEARVGDVRVVGASPASPAIDAAQVQFVLARMGVKTGELLNTAALEAALQRFNRLQDAQVQASVVAGSRFGTTDVEISLTEAPRARFSGFLDNAGRDTVGEVRGGLHARLGSVLRASDNLQFSATHSTGSASFALSYGTALTADDLKLELSASRGDIQVVSGPFQPLGIEGRSRDFTVGLNYPLQVTPEGLWNLYGRLSVRDSLSTIGGADQGTIGFGLLTVGALQEVQRSGTAWYLDNSLTVGAPRGNGNSSDNGGESFVYYRGQLTRFDRLGPQTQLLLRGGLQLSNSDLVPSSEQFQVGGAQSVRGYSSGLLSGRNGYLASAEMRVRLGAESAAARRPDAPDAPVLQGLLFVDHGGAVPFRGGNQSRVTRHDFISSVGLGLQVDKGPGFSARAVLAHPLTRNPAETKDSRLWLHLSLNLALN